MTQTTGTRGGRVVLWSLVVVAVGSVLTPRLYGTATLTSRLDQRFEKDASVTLIEPITITQTDSTAVISASSDIRIRIPASFSTTWDTTDTTIAVVGNASGKVQTTVSFPTTKICLIRVDTDFAANDTITVYGLRVDPSSVTSEDNYELITDGSDTGATAATDDKDQTIYGAQIYSDDDQQISTSESTPAVTDFVVQDNSSAASITAASDIRIRIPTAGIQWDTTDTSISVTMSGAGNVSTTASFPTSATCVLDVTVDFAAGSKATISGLKFGTPAAATSADRLDLLIDGGSNVAATDRRILVAGGVTTAMSAKSASADDTTINDVTITLTAAGQANTTDNIRLIIPLDAPFTFTSTQSPSPTITVGTTGAAVTAAPTLEDDGQGGKVLRFTVTTGNTAAGTITISGVQIDVDNDGTAANFGDLYVSVNGARNVTAAVENAGGGGGGGGGGGAGGGGGGEFLDAAQPGAIAIVSLALLGMALLALRRRSPGA